MYRFQSTRQLEPKFSYFTGKTESPLQGATWGADFGASGGLYGATHHK